MRTSRIDRITKGTRFAAFALLMTVLPALMAHAQASIDKVKIGTGTANVITLQSAGVGGSRIISIPDPGGAGSKVILSTLSGTAQSIAGPLALSGTPTFSVSSGSSTTFLAVNLSNQVVTAAGTAGLSISSSTVNTIPVWTGSAALGNSLLTDNGSVLNYNSKFADTASDGGAYVAGTLAVTSTATLTGITAGIPYGGLLAINGSNQIIIAAPTSNFTGAGTANTIALFPATGKELVNSLLTDNATILNYNSGSLVDTAADGGIYVGGNFQNGGAVQYHYTAFGTGSGQYTATYNDFVVELTKGNGSPSFTPFGTPVAGQAYLIYKSGTGSAALITTVPAHTWASGETRMIIYDGTNWHYVQ